MSSSYGGLMDHHGARGAAFAAVAYALAVMLAGSNLPTPLYPAYQKAFGLSPLVVTLVYSTYALTVMPCLLVFGPLSDAVGRRRTLIPAIVVAIVAAGAFAAATGVVLLFVAQVFEGVSMGAIQGTAVPALIEVEPSGDVDRASLVGSAATVGGAAVGPLLAGVLAQYVAWPRRAPFLVEIVLLGTALVLLMRLFPHDAGSGRRWRPRRPSVPAEIRRGFAAAASSAFLAWAVASLFLSLVPSYIVEAAHTRNAALIGAAAAAMLACSAVVQITGRRMSAVRSQALGLLFVTASAAGLIAVAHVESFAPVVVAGVLAGVGLGFAFRGSLQAVNGMAPADRKGEVVASYYLIVYLGTALPVIGVGLLAERTGLVDAVQAFAYAAAICCVLAVPFVIRSE